MSVGSGRGSKINLSHSDTFNNLSRDKSDTVTAIGYDKTRRGFNATLACTHRVTDLSPDDR